MEFKLSVGPPDRKLQHMGDGLARDFGAVRIPLIFYNFA